MDGNGELSGWQLRVIPYLLGAPSTEEGCKRARVSKAAVLGVLPAGTEVSILRENPGGWYLVIHRARPGFVHKSYVKPQKHRNPTRQVASTREQFVTTAGIILGATGLILVVSVMAPFLLKIATVLVAALIAVILLDLAFQLGALYSLFTVSLGLLFVVLFLTKRKRRAIPTSTVSPVLTKAA